MEIVVFPQVILKQLVAAAAEMERQGVFHRDVKLENILIQTCRDGPRVRIIDFGLSCFVNPSSVFRSFFGEILLPFCLSAV